VPLIPAESALIATKLYFFFTFLGATVLTIHRAFTKSGLE